jgi:hypothetical protein
MKKPAPDIRSGFSDFRTRREAIRANVTHYEPGFAPISV